ncbi:inositol monophosphatase family protein [Crocosphaera sp. Alani8]|uniref:inositol monophosphatase family protein n=1 Tax=Crocosphaera sp. Alani8 TaxID=3038952 RepID=UPI00313AA193
MESPETKELQIFLDVATEAAMTAGVILEDLVGKLEKIEEKGRPGDLVTEADKKAEVTVLNILKRRVPDHQILAEESGKIGTNDSDYLWVIDPLDGTTNYAHGYPASAVSVGLLWQGKSIVGAIYNPFTKELFRGAKGLGATLNYRPIKVSQTEQLSNSLLVTGFAYDRRETRDTNYPEFCYLTHITQGVRRAGSASLDIASVACGRLDGYWERGLSPWDIAAGIVILEEAGGKVTAYDESPLKLEEGRLLATNGKIHGSLSQALKEALPWLKEFYT